MSKYLTLNSGLQVSYHRQGKGQPMILIPGWCYPYDVFEKNINAFAKHYDVVTYDPISHGRSDISETHSNYRQYGKDLHEIITALKLENPIFLGWSLGSHIAYSYMDQFGFDNIATMIAVDESPYIIQQQEGDWSEGSAEEIEGLLNLIASDTYLSFYKDYMIGGFETPPQEELVNRFTQFASRLSPQLASDILRSSTQHDYSQVAIEAAKKLPFLTILRKDWSERAIQWIEQQQPTSQHHVLGAHIMLYEYADIFNQQVLDFLEANP